jgi:ABC-2 type transport system ATP-binding protein
VIRAVELGKRFDRVTALDAVTFEARPGEVLGFLGPNGAGKTTALRIVTGYLPASTGRVEVCGLDVAIDPLRARRSIGYLPEAAPLYPEMRAEEYLRYRAALKGIPGRQATARVEEALALAGASAERRQVIGRLSKGYRQRVGLADALLGRPEVLVLDEPTDGLDPNQRRDLLAQVAALGRDRTVVLSTHVLPEVESVCQRVVILDRGRVIAEGVPAELARAEARLRVVARGDRAALAEALRALPGVRQVKIESVDADVCALLVESEGDQREAVALAVARVGALRELRPTALGLDEVFARLTGGGLREPPKGAPR